MWNFRVSSDNPVVIEWQLCREGARWCFYAVADSPNEAKRILSVLAPTPRRTNVAPRTAFGPHGWGLHLPE